VAAAPPYRILVVEDEPAVADLPVTLLPDEDYAVALARDGTAAIDLLAQTDTARGCFDLVVLDMMLPGVTGGSELQHVLSERAGLPIIGLSADPAALAQGAALGATATLGKPFDIGELLALIERHCGPPRQ
jgi:CheY-like chemotaxis protein